MLTATAVAVIIFAAEVGFFDLLDDRFRSETEFLGKATARDGVTAPREMKPMLSCERVVKKCVKASIKGRVMCVTNWYTKLQHLLFKILPDGLLSRMWLGMLNKKV